MGAKRKGCAEGYRYGFNGKENDNEVKGNGNQQDYGFRIYDPRLGRFLSVDPLTQSFPMLTPYQFAANSPIANVDLDGQEAYSYLLTRNDGNTILTFVNVETTREIAGFKYTPQKCYTVFYNDKSYSFGNGTGLNNIGFKSNQEAFDAFTKNPDDKKWIDDKAIGTLKEEVETITSAVAILSKLASSIQKSEDEGIIYRRRDKSGKEKDYVGQAKSEKRYEERQKEHQRNNKDADYEFEIIDRGKPGKNLDAKEQKYIDAGGGPTNKSNPNGGLQNKKNVIRKDN